MPKIKESELENFLKKFENKNVIEVELDENIEGKIKVEKAKIKFDNKNGFLLIEGNLINLRINSAFVYRYEENNNEFKIELEGLKITVK